MKGLGLILGSLLGGFLVLPQSVVAQGSTFTYQGRLADASGVPLGGSYDLQFKLHDTATGTNQIGATLTNAAVAVSNGLFVVALDFTSAPFNGSNLWLEIGVRTNGSLGDYDILAPTQPITATPYAIQSAKAESFTGAISDVQLSTNMARLDAANNFSGIVALANMLNTISGNGHGLTNLNLAQTMGQATMSNGSYFGDLNNNAVAPYWTFPHASFPGQLLTLYSSTIGGDTAGQEFIAGSDLGWRRARQFGRVTIFETNGVTGEALLVKTTNGSDNVISIQNQASNHFSAMRYINWRGQEVGANGHGNTSAPFYAANNFLEDYANYYGFYFASRGFINGGLERGTGAFVWYDGVSGTNDASANAVARLTRGGVLNISNVNYGYNNPSMNGGAGIPLFKNEGNRLWLDPAQIDPNGTLAPTNIQIANNLPGGGGVDVGYAGLTIGNQIKFVERKYGLYQELNGVTFFRADPASQLPFNNVAFPETLLVGGTNSTDSGTTLQVQGSESVPLVAITADYTIAATDSTVLLNGTNLTATLPTAVGCRGRKYVIKEIANSSGTVAAAASQNIDGAATYSLTAQYSLVAVQSDGVQWWVIAAK